MSISNFTYCYIEINIFMLSSYMHVTYLLGESEVNALFPVCGSVSFVTDHWNGSLLLGQETLTTVIFLSIVF